MTEIITIWNLLVINNIQKHAGPILIEMGIGGDVADPHPLVLFQQSSWIFH